MQPFGNRLDDHFGAGEALSVGKFLPVVDDVDSKAHIAGDSREVMAHVSSTNDEQPRRGCQRVDMHVHASTANQSVLLREVVVQLVMEQLRASGRQGLPGFPEGSVFVAPTTDRSERAAIGPHQHLRARSLRRRALRAHDRHQRDAFASRQRVRRGRQQFFVQTSTSIFAFCFNDWMKASAFCCFCCSARKSLIRALTCSNGTVDAGRCSVTLMMW